MTFASRTQFHVKRPGEGPSRGLLRDCITSPINRAALVIFIARLQEVDNDKSCVL